MAPRFCDKEIIVKGDIRTDTGACQVLCRIIVNREHSATYMIIVVVIIASTETMRVKWQEPAYKTNEERKSSKK